MTGGDEGRAVQRELRTAQGTRAAEHDFCDHVLALARETREDPALLALPVRVVLPSTSLLQHISAVLASRHALAGVHFETAYALASRVSKLESAGPGVFDALVVRAAEEAPVLRRDLGELEGGFDAVVGAVRDLVDAGFEGQVAAPCSEALDRPGARAERASAILETAQRTLELLAEHDLAVPATIQRRAAAMLRAEPAVLRARAVLIYGFANATGGLIELFEALMRTDRASAWLDLSTEPQACGSHTERLLEALSAVPAATVVKIAEENSNSRPGLTQAPGAQAEVRAVVHAIRERLDAGARPESIRVVARDLAPYRSALRRDCARFGVPFSGVGARGFTTPLGRRIRALLELLSERGRTPIARWFEACECRPPWTAVDEGHHVAPRALELGLRSLGYGRVRDLGSTELRARLAQRLRDKPRVPPALQLPAAQGFEPDLQRGGVRLNQLSVPEWALSAARTAAADLLAQPALASDTPRTFASYLATVHALTRDGLGWDASLREIEQVQDGAGSPDTRGLLLTRRECLRLLGRALEERTSDALGGEGGGVSIVDVTEDRGRTSDTLFVLGMGRGVFPRTVREDTLLGDDLRRELRPLLPDLGLKGAGYDEERYLFAQLLSSATDVRLSWQTENEDGKATPRSPLIDRLLQRAGDGEQPVTAPAALDLSNAGLRLPALETVQLAGLARGSNYEELLALALSESHAEEGEATKLAAARTAVLSEQDRRNASTAELGPYYGFIGRTHAARDPRRSALHVTTLEGLARCGWQTFLGRFLKLASLPDPLGPLPELDKRLVGNAVHAALELALKSDFEKALEDALAQPPAPAAWPTGARVREVVRKGAWRVLARDSSSTLDLSEALTEKVLPLVQNAMTTEGGDELRIFGPELEGQAPDPRPNGDRAIHFRTDLVAADGKAARLIDYKTGKPISGAVSEVKQEEHFRIAIQSGKTLQAAAYAAARAGPVERELSGRYFFVGDEVKQRVFEVKSDAKELGAAYEQAAGILLDAFESGAFAPRLLDAKDPHKSPSTCTFCDVREACMQLEPGYKKRFERWTENKITLSTETPAPACARLVDGLPKRSS